MNNLYYAVIILTLSLTSYLACNNIIVGIIVFFCTGLYFFLIFDRLNKKERIKINRYHECFNFINTFLISLSIKSHLQGAYESTLLSCSADLREENDSLTNLDIKERLQALRKYFRFHIFDIFLDVIDIHVDQGGDILDVSSFLLREARHTEEALLEFQEGGKRKLVEIVILWFFTLLILLFIRFALSTFFEPMSKQIFYPIGITVFFLFIIFSIEIARRRIGCIEIKGWRDE